MSKRVENPQREPTTKPWFQPQIPGTTPVWMVCGSSPLARESMVKALDDWHPQVTITANGGHRLFDVRTGIDHPTFYFLSDSVACGLYAVDASFLRARYGTMLLTPNRVPSALKARGVENADQFIEVDPYAKAGLHTPGKYAGQPLSGLYMLDIALNRQAATVIVVGFDGYQSFGGETVVDYFDGRKGHGRSRTHNETMAGYMRSVAETRPGVWVYFYGDPKYALPEAERFVVVRPGETLEEVKARRAEVAA